MICGILITHGRLAEELVNVSRKILGEREALFAFSNTGLAPKVLYEQVLETMDAHGVGETVLMVDLRGGSCWTVARMIARDRPGLKVFAGVNLPMLLSFLTKRESLPLEALNLAMENDAHRGVTVD